MRRKPKLEPEVETPLEVEAEPEPVIELIAQRMPEEAGPLLGGGPEGNAHRKALARLVTDLVTTTHRLGKRLRRNLGEGVPDQDWSNAFGQYSKAVTSLLADERGRVKLLAGAKRAGVANLSDSQFLEELRKLALETIRDMPQDELEEALAIRESSRKMPVLTSG